MQKTLGRLADGLLARLLPADVASAEVCSPASWCHASGCSNGRGWRIDAHRQPNCNISYSYSEWPASC
ncbi:hypothetical protein [Couchioplanes azureus]|uniref:hypothetical protein n=1 Tax=Couchioplanes caeruleus TaxID=56438 RepID=UPI00166FAA01|nr:hypothetical protein [Couchioplanes caeruleus]GGQ75164.1 hypothetical protein GCM10010166_51380 [Couchioplanes caeruleus subsp. azureus]